ncbi:putative membrane protein [Povalibacter uvarum]|uniref:Putative membrane protein n=1 Tax=Povalibacter uvarum TaxID=732238 RepID=A0A841HWU3_9GAMM|nr:anthrone oxygenase family protein [Povalibacter uvarum]MBB6096422.1 putative membrane protein [Povalibacter uvarum]
MNTGHLQIASILGAVGTGLIGGVFFAFSTFVMQALARMPAAQGIAAMQHINVTVLNPWFLGVFMGTGLVSIGVLVLALMQARSGAALLIVAATLYFVGTFLVTMVFNVPRNDALAAATPDAAQSAVLWAKYLREWTFWNHVRTVAALAACATFCVALTR